MSADEDLCGRMHGVDVQLLSSAPGTACFQRQWCAAVHDSIDLGPANAGQAGVPVSRYALAVYHSHGHGPHSCVNSLRRAAGRVRARHEVSIWVVGGSLTKTQTI